MPSANPLDANGSMLRLNDNFGRGGTGSAPAYFGAPALSLRRFSAPNAYTPSPSPAAGLTDAPENPWVRIGQEQRAQQQAQAAQGKFRGEAFGEAWDAMTPEAKPHSSRRG
jgi:hypothetical protein